MNNTSDRYRSSVSDYNLGSELRMKPSDFDGQLLEEYNYD